MAAGRAPQGPLFPAKALEVASLAGGGLARAPADRDSLPAVATQQPVDVARASAGDARAEHWLAKAPARVFPQGNNGNLRVVKAPTEGERSRLATAPAVPPPPPRGRRRPRKLGAWRDPHWRRRW